jgi:hypothetical protein
MYIKPSLIEISYALQASLRADGQVKKYYSKWFSFFENTSKSGFTVFVNSVKFFLSS